MLGKTKTVSLLQELSDLWYKSVHHDYPKECKVELLLDKGIPFG